MTINVKQWAALLLAVPFIAASFFCWERKSEGSAAVSGDTGGLVLIIDAGHGGEDGGAVGANGQKESELNLAIARRLAALCGLFAQDYVMTRERETIDYPRDASTTRQRKSYDQSSRARLIKAYPNGVYLSIHQNCFPDPRPFGSQTLYGPEGDSRALAELMHQSLIDALCPENRRVAAPVSEDIFLMRSAGCTAVLVECGFMSNPEELARLMDEEYQMKLAGVLMASYLSFCSGQS